MDPRPLASDELKPRPGNTTGSTNRRMLPLAAPNPWHLRAKVRQAHLVPPAVDIACQACAEGKAGWPLFLWGPPGTGKTCAALHLLDRIRGAGRGHYFDAADLASKAADAMMGRLEHGGRTISAELFWYSLGEAQLVVLDDLGARERVKDHAYDCVKKLLDLREGKPLVAISNMRPGELVRIYDDRIVSRLASGTVLFVPGSDRRLDQRPLGE